ncbi:MAG: NADP-dependent oxidoreductase [Firmicutes bacterium]|nr:NADP-dependent oxidoreductase [Alicyclobacillaceae bacterium]MCL6497484.1 NADP-dependent oxidoreductase [Bacillota bacterium]
MKAVIIPRFGGPEVLTVQDLPTPEPGPGQVRVRVRAATVNPTDLALRAGTHRVTQPFPLIPGMELAGEIDAVGPEVTDRKVGEAVLGIVTPFRPEGGAQAEQVVAFADSVVPIPAGKSLVEAATLPMNGLTARLALDRLALPPGSTLAITGSAGAVGGYLIQLAKVAGLKVVADAAPRDEALVHSLGADWVVERGPRVAEAIRGVIPEGVDALVDCAVQGAVVLPAVRDGGQVAAVRLWQGGTERNIRVHQVMVTEYLRNRPALEALRRLVEEGRLTLRVAETFPPEQAAEAHRRLEAGGVRGRLVLVF